MHAAPFAAPTLFATLRHITAEAHARLEIALDLLGEPLSRDRFVAVLKRFYGFHVAWEQTSACLPELHTVTRNRTKTVHLERDLLALGFDDFENLPRCDAARTLAVTAAEAVGVCYVLEGSTLGGKMISKALSAAPWLPQGGLTFFDPYGEHTGAMWQSYRAWADGFLPADAYPDAHRAAVNTFALLTRWLPEPKAA